MHRMMAIGRMAWAGKKDAAQKAMRELMAIQRSDGGWSDIASMEHTAYAIGKALFSPQTVGLPTSDDGYERGVRSLGTQRDDGSSYRKTRALALRPSFAAGFLYGKN